MDTQQLTSVKNALLNAGLSQPVLDFALSQAAFESGGFTSDVFKSFNNVSGIEYVNQNNATDSTRSKQDGGTFAAYDNLDNWAVDFVRVIGLQRPNNTIGAPIEATTLADYVDRLAANNYFGNGSPKSYLNGLQSYLNKISVSGDTSLTDNKIWARAKTIGNLAMASDNLPVVIAGGIVIFLCLALLIILPRFKRK